MLPLARFVPYTLSLLLVDAISQNSSAQWGTKQCTVAGDPHVWSFCGQRFDPMHGTGHWWIVKTPDKSVMIQGSYGGCGDKNGGGWQTARAQGIPRTCLISLGISGSFINNKVLGIKAPCDWDWGKGKCRNSPANHKRPIILVDGKEYTSDFSKLIPGVAITPTADWRFIFHFDNGIWMQMNFGGKHWSRSAHTYMNLVLKMPQQTVTDARHQCGHCGPYDCSANVRNLFNGHGGLQPNQPEYCKPEVSCAELYVKDTFSCWEADPHIIDLTIDDCPEDHRAMSKFTCTQAFNERKLAPSQDEMEECIEDTCFGGDYFAKEDAKEAEREKECAEKMFELEQNFQDAQWEVQDNEDFVEWDCPNGEPVPDMITLDRVPRDLHRVSCPTRECKRAVSRYNRVAVSWERRVKRLARDMIQRRERCNEALRYLAEAREKLEAAREALEYCKA